MKKNSTSNLFLEKINLLKIVFFFCSFFLLSVHGNGQWQWLNPKPSAYVNNKIVFTNHQTGYIINSKGDLYKTTDVGVSWTFVRNFPGAACMSIVDSTGVIAGTGGSLYVSNDNGNTWQITYPSVFDDYKTVNIVSRDTFFLSNNYTGNYGAGNIYKTNDRGKTWVTEPCSVAIHAITFVNSKTGFVGGEGVILRTDDGGVTWQQKRQINTIPSDILAMQFINKDTGFAFEKYDSLLITHDGGNTWQATASYPAEGMYTMHFLNANDGYLAGELGNIVATHDGGKTIEKVLMVNLSGYDLNSLYFISKDTGFAVGLLGRILKTTDGGANWSTYSPTYGNINDLSFGNTNTAYATVGLHIYKTTDNWQNYQKLALTTGIQYASQSQFEKTHFYSADSGFVTTSFPVLVHHTYDGGITWDTTNPFQNNDWSNVNDMQFLTNKTGFICLYSDYNCSIAKTKDGGNNWNIVWQAQYQGETFSRIFYINEATGYGIRNYTLYKTIDSSKTWTQVYTQPNFVSLNAVCFISIKKGFIAADDGSMLTTNDSGKTWISPIQNAYFPNTVNTMKFFNPKVGYLTAGNNFGPAEYGSIYETIDSGATWAFKKNAGGRSITFTPDSAVIISGYGGAILTSKIKEVEVDSLTPLYIQACSTTLSARITAVLTQADSVYFEITDSKGQAILLPASPFTINDTTVVCRASTNALTQGVNYKATVKYKIDGTYGYSSILNFNANGLPAPPVITRSGNVLTSNYYYGNQWYKNDTLIAGATLQNDTIVQPVTYTQCFTVKETYIPGCSSISDKLCIDQSTLAVKLTKVNAVYTVTGITVSWQALSEENTSSFIVQGSADGVNFYNASTQAASNNTSAASNYSFIDSRVLTENVSKMYYRIATVSNDGSISYSRLVAVYIPQSQGGIKISPNPASTFVTIYFKNNTASATISLFDVTGKRVFLTALENIVHGSYQFPVNNFATGIYFINVKTKTENYTTRLIVAR